MRKPDRPPVVRHNLVGHVPAWSCFDCRTATIEAWLIRRDAALAARKAWKRKPATRAYRLLDTAFGLGLLFSPFIALVVMCQTSTLWLVRLPVDLMAFAWKPVAAVGGGYVSGGEVAAIVVLAVGASVAWLVLSAVTARPVDEPPPFATMTTWERDCWQEAERTRLAPASFRPTRPTLPRHVSARVYAALNPTGETHVGDFDPNIADLF